MVKLKDNFFKQNCLKIQIKDSGLQLDTSCILWKQFLNTVKRLAATATMPVSVTLSGNVEKPKNVTVRRNGLRNLNLLAIYNTGLVTFTVL